MSHTFPGVMAAAAALHSPRGFTDTSSSAFTFTREDGTEVRVCCWKCKQIADEYLRKQLGAEVAHPPFKNKWWPRMPPQRLWSSAFLECGAGWRMAVRSRCSSFLRMAVEVDQSIFSRVLLDYTDSLDDWDFVCASFDIWDVRALLDGFDSTKPGPRGGASSFDKVAQARMFISGFKQLVKTIDGPPDSLEEHRMRCWMSTSSSAGSSARHVLQECLVKGDVCLAVARVAWQAMFAMVDYSHCVMPSIKLAALEACCRAAAACSSGSLSNDLTAAWLAETRDGLSKYEDSGRRSTHWCCRCRTQCVPVC
jgi:hypothetical protein